MSMHVLLMTGIVASETLGSLPLWEIPLHMSRLTVEKTSHWPYLARAPALAVALIVDALSL